MIKTGDRVFYNGIYGTVDVVVSRDPISPPYTVYGDDGRFYTAYDGDIMIISNNEDDKQ